MTVYVISQLTIHNREQYDIYESQFEGVFAKFDGKLLSIDEAPMVLAGEWSATRSVLIEFPSKSSALAWMTSEEYRAIGKHRDAGSTAQSILVKALD